VTIALHYDFNAATSCALTQALADSCSKSSDKSGKAATAWLRNVSEPWGYAFAGRGENTDGDSIESSAAVS
jgi:hypothetical protein